MDDAYTRLAHAIVVLAAKDYDAELDWFQQNPPRDEEDKQQKPISSTKPSSRALSDSSAPDGLNCSPVWMVRRS